MDYAATTPVLPEVFRLMKPYFGDKFGNPGSLYDLGRVARVAIREAREKIAKVLGCKSDELFFTSSATEANNLVILGLARANKEFGKRIIISNVEHKATFSACEALKEEGFEIIKIPVGEDGIIILDEFKKALTPGTILVSVTMADSETGTIQPIAKIAKIISDFGNRQLTTYNTQPITDRKPIFHIDASQGALYQNIGVEYLGADLLTLSSHKIGGPKGVAGLFIKRGTKIRPIIYGGGQQRNIRSGTENVPAIVGFGEAVSLCGKNKKEEAERIKGLRDKLEKGIFEKIPKAILNGHKENRLPNFLNVSFLDIEGEALLLYLDNLGISVSTGSACDSESLEPSYILQALGRSYEFIHGSIRFSLGKANTESDIDYTLKHLPVVVEKLRKISPLNLKMGEKKEISEPKAFLGGKTPHFLRKSEIRSTKSETNEAK